jgi:hypothetical protein
MTPTEFLRMRNIVAKDKTDLIIGFDNGTEESLIELLDSYHELKLEKLRVADVMLRFKLRLNIEEWGMYKKGDEDYFNIKLHDEQNGLTRFPIDKRWDVISCEIVNVA